jgi:quinol monooxygenase YgiN
MFIRLTRGQADPSRIDELTRATPEIIQRAQQLAGCRSFQIGIDRTSGKIVAISTWDSQDQAQAIAQLRSSAEALGAQFEAAEMYEVVAQT